MINALLLQDFDVEIYALFPQFFVTQKQTPQTFLFLECMGGSSTMQMLRLFAVFSPEERVVWTLLL